MKDVDYLKLSEQYANFLVAVGGVSITVLSIVLAFNNKDTGPSRSFLAAALIVATAACFIGAHMMAETAAFINFTQLPPKERPSGERLFMIATTNIFIAIGLVLFALKLLTQTSDQVQFARRFSFLVFLVVLLGAYYWMALAAYFRAQVQVRWWVRVLVIVLGFIIGAGWGLWLFNRPSCFCTERFLFATFGPGLFSTVGALVIFAWIFRQSSRGRLRRTRWWDLGFFDLTISVSYASLIVAALRL